MNNNDIILIGLFGLGIYLISTINNDDNNIVKNNGSLGTNSN